MVFPIEPVIYLPEEKLGLRIEDIFYLDPGGKLIDLTLRCRTRPTKWSGR